LVYVSSFWFFPPTAVPCQARLSAPGAKANISNGEALVTPALRGPEMLQMRR